MDKIRQIQGFTLSLLFSWDISEVLWVCMCHGTGECGSPSTGIWWGHLHLLDFGHWFLSPCAWAHYGPWLFHAALAMSEPSSQPLSIMSTTLLGTMNIFVGSPLGFRRFKLSHPFLPGMAQLPSLLCWWWFAAHLCFTQEARHRISCSWNPPNQDELSVILTLGLVADNKGSRAKLPECKHSATYYVIWGSSLAPLCLSFLISKMGSHRVVERVSELKYMMHLE